MRSLRLPALGAAILGISLLTSSLSLHAQTQTKCTYKPSVGQAGKDVIWVPTPDSVVDRMLRMAEVSANDYVIDLGSGDGKIVIYAAQRFKAKGQGIEYNPDMVDLSRCLAREAKLTDVVRFDQGDIFKSDFTQASVITMYLLPSLNLKLRPILFQKMKPGTRVVSHQFTMGDWQPDETSVVEGRSSYFWVIPANAGGSWRMNWGTGRGEAGGDLSIDQTFQKIEGKIRFGVIEATLREPRLRGENISFDMMDEQGVLRTFTGRIRDNRMEGTATGPNNSTIVFTAVRNGPPPPIRGVSE